MKKEQFFEDQPILQSDLQRVETTTEDAITERQLDIFDYGVISNSQTNGEASAFLITQGPSSGLFVTVNTGTAISPEGERIIISAPVLTYNASLPTTMTDNGIGGTVLTPQSSGSQNIPVTDNSISSIWVGYLETADTSVFTLSEANNSRLFVKHDDGYIIAVTTTSTNPNSSVYVLIGEVTTSGGLVTNINSTSSLQADSTIFTIPASFPYQTFLNFLPNIPADLDRPNSIPSIPGYTYTTGIPAAGQFSVNFSNALVTFNAANAGAGPLTATYNVLHVRMQNLISRANTVGAQLHLNQPTTVYNLGSNVTLTAHVNGLGTGVVTPTNVHGLGAADLGLAGVAQLGQVLADSGIVTSTGNASATTSSLSPSAVSQALPASANLVTVAPLVAGEFVNIGGAVVAPLNIPTTTTFNFIDPVTSLPLPAGTYYFYVDPILKNVQKATAVPSGAFPIASIVWNGSFLILPIKDLRIFGTTGTSNIQLQTILALAAGVATDNRSSLFFNAKLIGTTVVTSPSYAYTGLGGTTLNLTTDGNPGTVTFPSIPANTTINNAATDIMTAIPNIKAIVTASGQLKLLSPLSLVINAGSANSVLGFTTSESSSGNVKEIRITGGTSSTGVAGQVIAAEIDFSYDGFGNLTQTVGFIGNKILTTNLTYNSDGSVKTVQEIVV